MRAIQSRILVDNPAALYHFAADERIAPVNSVGGGLARNARRLGYLALAWLGAVTLLLQEPPGQISSWLTRRKTVAVFDRTRGNACTFCQSRRGTGCCARSWPKPRDRPRGPARQAGPPADRSSS